MPSSFIVRLKFTKSTGFWNPTLGKVPNIITIMIIISSHKYLEAGEFNGIKAKTRSLKLFGRP